MNHPFSRRLIEAGIFSLPFLIAIPFTVLTENCDLVKDLLLIFTVFFLFFFWVSAWLDTARVKLVYDPLNRPVMLLLGLTAVWAVVNPYRHISFYEFLIVLCYVLFYFLVLNQIDNLKKVKLFLNLSLVLFAVVCTYGLFQYFGLDFIDWETKGKLLSSFGNPDFFAGYLVLSLPVILSFFIESRTSLGKLGLGALLLVGFFCLLGTLTRGAWIGFFFSLVAFAFWFIFEGEKKDFQKRLNGVLLLIATALVVSSLALHSKDLALRIRSIFAFGKDPSGMVRVIIWDGAFKAFLARPIFGWGLAGFRTVFPLFRTPQYYLTGIGQYTHHAHNEYLEWLVDTGIIGLAVFLYLLFVFFRESIRLFKSEDRFIRSAGLGIASGMLGLLVHNLFSPSLRWTVCGFFFWLAIALIASLSAINDRTKPSLKRRSQSTKTKLLEMQIPFANPLKLISYPLFLGLLVMTAVFCTRQFLAEKNLQAGKGYVRIQNWDKALNCLTTSLKQNPYLLSAYYQLGHVYNMKELYPKSIETYQKLEQLHPNYARVSYNLGCVRMNMDDWTGAQRDFSWATKLEDSPGNHAKLAEVYLKLKNQKAAEEEYRRVLALDPNFTGIYEIMAMGYLAEGKPSRAEAEFKKIIQKDPSSKEGHFQLARLYENQGRRPESIQEYQLVVSLDPKDSKAHNNLGAVYLQLGLVDPALAEFKNALTANPADVLAHFNLGRALLKKGRREDAFLEFGRVIQMAPESWIAREAAKFLAAPVSKGGSSP